MKFLNVYVLTSLISKIYSTTLPTKKICRDCIHFIGDNTECRKFGDTNIITGKVIYKSARSVREDDTKCGENAILFQENNLKIVTVPYYFFKENSRFMLLSAILSSYFCAILFTLHK
jgi:hypothetical protein